MSQPIKKKPDAEKPTVHVPVAATGTGQPAHRPPGAVSAAPGSHSPGTGGGGVRRSTPTMGQPINPARPQRPGAPTAPGHGVNRPPTHGAGPGHAVAGGGTPVAGPPKKPGVGPQKPPGVGAPKTTAAGPPKQGGTAAAATPAKPPKPSEEPAPSSPPTGSTVPLTSIVECGDQPMEVQCPNCFKNITTETKPVVGRKTICCCSVLLLFFGYLGCCIIPFCSEDCQDVKHTCPDCKADLGTYKKPCCGKKTKESTTS